jgi:hypothetical protein
VRKGSLVVLVVAICCSVLYLNERGKPIFASLIPKDNVSSLTVTCSRPVSIEQEMTEPVEEERDPGDCFGPPFIAEKVEKKKPEVKPSDQRYANYVESYFKKSVEKLKEFGFTGPFAEEAARYAIARQIIEDGIDRDHKVSMVGMIPGGLNKRVVSRLGLEINKVNESGYKLTRVTANDGQGCYAFYGDYSNVLSVVAVVMVWDEYANGEEGFLRKEDLRSAWNKSKELSTVLAKEPGNLEAKAAYEELGNLRRESIERCNSMYGPNGSSVKMIVTHLKDVFDFLAD